MFEPSILITIIATFLLAGAVKGVIGLGLPTVSLALLTVAIDLPSAMALLLVPSFVTNLWQASVGGRAREILLRLWPFLLMATVTVWLGAMALTRVNPNLLSALLGALLVTYSLVSLAGVRFALSAKQETWLGPVIGTANGILTGMTGSFVVPGVMFLQAIGLSREMLIQAMGILFTVSTLALAVALQGQQFLTVEMGAASVIGLLPAVLGMVLGQSIRQRLSEALFRRVFFISLLFLGAYIIAGV
jgi:uncharacterized membrane protein YfcA